MYMYGAMFVGKGMDVRITKDKSESYPYNLYFGSEKGHITLYVSVEKLGKLRDAIEAMKEKEYLESKDYDKDVERSLELVMHG